MAAVVALMPSLTSAPPHSKGPSWSLSVRPSVCPSVRASAADQPQLKHVRLQTCAVAAAF